jgi:heptosyltransferase III
VVFGRIISWFIGPRTYSNVLEPQHISSVLICRINGRLGNTVFLTPLVKRVHELFPQAAIDLAVAYPKAGELVDNFPGLRRVITFPHRGGRLARRYLAAVRQLRAKRYDLAIDPVPESTSSRIALTLCRSRFRVGFAMRSQWAPLTHAVVGPDEPMHQAILPVFLLCEAMRKPYAADELRLSLCLRPGEIESGQSTVARLVEQVSGRPLSDQGQTQAVTPGTFGFFAHATGLKLIEREWWLAFWNAFLELEPEAQPIEFLPTPSTAPLDARFPSMHLASPRALTAAIMATRVFISADAGPMHLSSSTCVPTVALFRATDPTLYGPLKPTDLVINVAESTPQLVAQRCQRLWRESTGNVSG